MSKETLQPAAMEHETNESEPGSFIRSSSINSSWRRHSLRLSGALSLRLGDDAESENVSEAGDIGDRALRSNRPSESGSTRFSVDNPLENGVAFPIPEDKLLQSHGFWFRDSTPMDTSSPVTPLPEEIISPISTDAMVAANEEKQEKEKRLMLLPLLDYVSCLIYLAVFGILGVLTRYLLQKLFGPGLAGVTNNHSPLYLDLPSNMVSLYTTVGSFLMGWLGVVFKDDISDISGHLAIGLTTGYLGSLTTFSGWNQKMLDLSVDGHWVFSVVGFLLGLFLAAYSIKFGNGTAKSFKSLLNSQKRTGTRCQWRVDSIKRHFVVMGFLVLMLCCLWSVSGTLLHEEFDNHNSASELWLACIVGPPGVWTRWFLARLNGRGLGKAGTLKWMPFGTLIANVSAACVMAALATLKRAVNSEDCNTISTGIQLGFLGCLSTVSTFIAEYNAMEESKKNWRAYVYALTTIIPSFGFGILIYAVPVWGKGIRLTRWLIATSASLSWLLPVNAHRRRLVSSFELLDMCMGRPPTIIVLSNMVS